MASRTLRSLKLSQLKSWYNQGLESPVGYRLKGQDFDVITKGMSTAQIQLMLTLVCSSSAKASEDSRKFWGPKYHAMRQAAERATGDSKVSYAGLRLVVANG